jgi:hypothetical protein
MVVIVYAKQSSKQLIFKNKKDYNILLSIILEKKTFYVEVFLMKIDQSLP